MMVLIGVDPHKGSHTAVAIDRDESPLGELRMRSKTQCAQLLEWAVQFPQRRWAIESASGLGYLVAQQLVAAGEDVVDVPPTLSARVRVLDSTKSAKKTRMTRAPRRWSRCGTASSDLSCSMITGRSCGCSPTGATRSAHSEPRR